MLNFLVFIFLALYIEANSGQPTSGVEQPQSAALTYVPLENRKDDLAVLNTYWPFKEDAFVADLDSLNALRWAIVVCEAKGQRGKRDTGLEDEDNTTMTTPVTTQRPVPVTGTGTGTGGLLDNRDALGEINVLRQYIEEAHTLKVRDYDYRYSNVCLSYFSPIANRSVCRFPEVNILDALDSSTRAKNLQKPILYPYYGDKSAPLGIGMMTGPVLGGVETDHVTGDVRSVRSVALRYFFKTQGDMDKISSDWRNSLRDHLLNKYMTSSVIDFRYMDDEMMKLKLDEKNSNAQLAARLLDPSPNAASSGYWPDGLTAQLIFNRVTDLSRDAEVRAILKALAAFENTPYTFGEEGTLCWLRSFLAWRKALVSYLYGGSLDSDEKKEDVTLVSSPSPFKNFKEDLRIFFENPRYPVYSRHVVLEDVDGDGAKDVKAFRCFVTMKNLTDRDQRSKGIQYLRDIAAGNPNFNISVLGVDFFPPVPLAGSRTAVRGLATLGMGILTILLTRFL